MDVEAEIPEEEWPTWMREAMAREPAGVPVLDELGGMFVQGYHRDVLLERGVAYPKVAPDPGGWGLLDAPKGCFRNATLAVFDRPLLQKVEQRLTYVEGYAFCEGVPFPVHHAWVVTPDDLVVDSTWPAGSGRDYFGIPFGEEELRTLLLRSEEFGVLDLLWRHDWAREHFGL